MHDPVSYYNNKQYIPLSQRTNNKLKTIVVRMKYSFVKIQLKYLIRDEFANIILINLVTRKL